MEIRTACSPNDFKNYTTKDLREQFLASDLFEEDQINLIYSHIDRIITGTAVPKNKKLFLSGSDELKAEYFLQRRELGIINIGAKGKITVDSKEFILDNKDGIYIGKSNKEVIFESIDSQNPAKFYLNSAPAHKEYKTMLIKQQGEILDENTVVINPQNKVELGSPTDSNHRIISKYILPGQVESCQLVMGITSLMSNSVWNTMPCHTHDRRMEVYLYFDMKEDDFVVHLMGQPNETRHIIVRNNQAVISPSWSIHSGCGSKSYSFIWGMVGENQDFADMDHIENKFLC